MRTHHRLPAATTANGREGTTERNRWCCGLNDQVNAPAMSNARAQEFIA
jgi:hypothetical protein